MHKSSAHAKGETSRTLFNFSPAIDRNSKSMAAARESKKSSGAFRRQEEVEKCFSPRQRKGDITLYALHAWDQCRRRAMTVEKSGSDEPPLERCKEQAASIEKNAKSKTQSAFSLSPPT